MNPRPSLAAAAPGFTFGGGGPGSIGHIVGDPAVVKRFEELGITVARGHAAQFTEFVARQVADWAPAIKAADVKPQCAGLQRRGRRGVAA